jgi:hypothetical protein
VSLTSDDQTFGTNFRLTDSVGPVDLWQSDQVRRAIYHLPTSPRLAGQNADIVVALVSPSGQTVAETVLAQVNLETRQRQFDTPKIRHPAETVLGEAGQIKLLGYDVSPTENNTLPLTLYWQAGAEMDTDYTVFVQLLDDTDQLVTQIDSQPQADAAPTTTWLSDEIVTDPYTLTLPPGLPTGDYRLITGMYNASTGQRLPVSTGEDFVDLQWITIQ